MVLPAGQAQTFTLTAISNNADRDVQNEARRTDAAIQSAVSQERFFIVYNALIVGNPSGDPQDDDNLTDAQIQYRDVFIDAGYNVGIDEDTGNWTFSWAVLGPEEQVTIYSVRTTLTPGTYATTTLNQIGIFFDAVTPPVTHKAIVVPINGGDILESDFGATNSVFYEYVVLVSQPNDVDHSAALKADLVTNITAYTTSNVEAYRLVEGG